MAHSEMLGGNITTVAGNGGQTGQPSSHPERDAAMQEEGEPPIQSQTPDVQGVRVYEPMGASGCPP